MSFILLFQIIAFITGVLLIILPFTVNIDSVSSEFVIHKPKTYKFVYTLFSIVSGIVLILSSITDIFGEKHGSTFVIIVIITEIVQTTIKRIYIKERDSIETEEPTNELGEKINIDEILDDSFFENRTNVETEKENITPEISEFEKLILEGLKSGQYDVNDILRNKFITLERLKELNFDITELNQVNEG